MVKPSGADPRRRANASGSGSKSADSSQGAHTTLTRLQARRIEQQETSHDSASSLTSMTGKKRTWREHLSSSEDSDGGNTGDDDEQGNSSNESQLGDSDDEVSGRRQRPQRASPPPDGGDQDDAALHSGAESTDSSDSLGSAPPSTVFGQSHVRGTKPTHTEDTIASSKSLVKDKASQEGAVPDWKDLRIEFSIWVEILQYAAVPHGPESIKTNWLLQTARVSRMFAEPAITVLYRCPPLSTANKIDGLVALLSRPPSEMLFNYSSKIECLRINVYQISLSPHQYASPHALIPRLPRLSEVQFTHTYDEPPYHHLEESTRWKYSEEIFDALGVYHSAPEAQGHALQVTRLKSWQWNTRFMGKGPVENFAKMRQIHLSPSFAGLRKLQLLNFQMPSYTTNMDPDHPDAVAQDEEYVRSIADAISALGQLEHIVFELSTIANAALLTLLPTTLRRVELINCWEVDSEMLGRFLTTHGHNLESLALNHNQSLNFAFLPVLGLVCPKLKELRIDAKYFRINATGYGGPLYDELLPEEQVPSWPKTLQILELDNLQGWGSESAAILFQSLIDRAPDLPLLRSLTIRCMLNIPWRQRSEFRQYWQDRLGKVFLRRPDPPKPVKNLRTIHMDSKGAGFATRRLAKKRKVGPSRHSGRIASQTSRSSGRSAKAVKGLRSLGRKQYEEPDTDEFDDDTSSSSDVEASSGEDASPNNHVEGSPMESDVPFVQGLCTVVDIIIDNQKPRDHQWKMDDFLNSESEVSDAEWDSDAEEIF